MPAPPRPADGGDSRSIILSDGSQYAETTFGTPMSVLGKDVIRFDVATVGLSTRAGTG